MLLGNRNQMYWCSDKAFVLFRLEKQVSVFLLPETGLIPYPVHHSSAFHHSLQFLMWSRWFHSNIPLFLFFLYPFFIVLTFPYSFVLLLLSGCAHLCLSCYLSLHQCFLPQSPLMFKDQMQQDVIMVLKFPSNSPVTHVAANTLPHLSMPAAVTVTCSRLFAVNRWHNTVGKHWQAA